GKFRLGRIPSAFLTLLVFFLVGGFLIATFVPLIVEQARNLAEVDYQSISQALAEPLDKLNDLLYRMGLANSENSADAQFQNALSDYFNPAALGNVFSSVIGIAGELVFAIFSIIFITFFFLKERGIFENFIVGVTPSGYEKQAGAAISSITRLLTRYFGGILIQITSITLFVFVGLSIFGVENALLIAFFAALVNVIPYLGPIIGAIFGVFITISSNLDLEFYTMMLPLILKVLAVFAAMQLMDNFLLQPFIFSNSVKAHPLEIFIVILMGAQLNGILGMILAIPTYTVLRVIARVFLSEFKIVKKLTGGIDDP
ncbi:MAG: AI-2E family transporter, partial [Saprospiraceae bacterium]|nr:AI-2E family transporter [Saprospiraceae bacterium]